jgi:hypothetical protein
VNAQSRNEDTSMLRYLAARDVPLRALGIADAMYAKARGGDVHSLGVQEYFRSEQRWDQRLYGRELLRPTQSFRPLLEHLAKDLPIVTNCQVREINYSDPGKVMLVNQRGEVRE